MKKRKTSKCEKVLAVVLALMLAFQTLPDILLAEAEGGQQKVKISGTVTLAASPDTPIGGVKVTAYDGSEQTVPGAETETRTDGTYDLEVPQNIVCKLSFAHADYKTVAIENITVGTEEISGQDASMTEKEETIITFEKSPGPFEVELEEEFSNSASVPVDTNTNPISYSITDGDTLASVDNAGKITTNELGDVTVKASIAADDNYKGAEATYQLSIIRVAGDIVFADKTPTTSVGYNGGTYKQEVTINKGLGVTYSIESQTTLGNEPATDIADIDSSSGELTIKNTGIVKVKATQAEDTTHSGDTDEYTLTINKGSGIVRFGSSAYTITYGENDNSFQQQAEVINGLSTVSYSIDSTTLLDGVTEADDVAEINTSTGELTIKNTGIIKVIATQESNANYEGGTAEYTLTINKASQNISFSTVPSRLEYRPEAYSGQVSVEGALGEVTYTISTGPEFASIDATSGAIVTKKATGDNQYFIISATASAGRNYQEKTIFSNKITVSRANQSGFAFAVPAPGHVTYNENGNKFSNVASGGAGKGQITYSIIQGEDVAAIDAESGVLKIKKAGTVKVKAAKAVDECYFAAEAEYTLVVDKADQSFAFRHGNTVSLTYGEKGTAYTNTAVMQRDPEAADEYGYSRSSKLRYKLLENTMGAILDEDTGKLTFANGKVGTLTVQATKAGDECYNSYTATYKLTMSYQPVPKTPYTLSGDKLNASGWYTGDVTIRAPKNYQISYSNDLKDNTWKDSVVYNISGTNSFRVYLKEISTGKITNKITVKDLKIDKTDPMNMKIEYKTSVINQMLQTLSFGFYHAPLEVKLHAEDTDSKIESIIYQYKVKDGSEKDEGKEATTVRKGDKGYTVNKDGSVDFVFSIPAQFKGNVKFSALDVSGRKSTMQAGDMVIVDTIRPQVDISYSGTLQDMVVRDTNVITRNSTANADETTRFVYSDAVTAVIEVEEANFYKEDITIAVERGGALTTDYQMSDWKKDAKSGKYRRTITLSQDGDYQIYIEYVDKSGNPMEYKSKEYAKKTGTERYVSNCISVDTTAPIVSVSYDNNEVFRENYYNAARTAVIRITDENFRPEEVKLVVTSVNAAGEAVSIPFTDLKSWSDWAQDGITWTAQLTFDWNAAYTLDIDYQDIAKNTAADYPMDSFIVDTVAPTAEISYNDGVQESGGTTYYDDDVSGTIVVTEENFFAEDVNVTISADGGAEQSIPVSWSDNSMTQHTGTFTLSEDGDYIVKVNYMDRSTNAMQEYTSGQLTVDTTIPTINVTNIQANSANKDETYGFTITADDTNLDISSFTPVLTGVMRDESGRYTTTEIPLENVRTAEAGKSCSVTVDNLDKDAIYTLSCTVQDMADNEYTNVQLADGNEYDQVQFSINRDGSTYAIDKSTEATVEHYYVYDVQEDVVIDEVNVDPIETYAVTMNGTVLAEGTDYTTTLSNTSGEWSKRTYTIGSEMFSEEGEYNIVVESTDKTDTTSYSDVKKLNVSFVVDKTAPTMTVGGLENGGRYQVSEQTVTVMPIDNGGKVSSFRAEVQDSDGQLVKGGERFAMSGEELDSYLSENDGMITFTIPEGREQQVVLTCADSAVHADGNTNECQEVFKQITVSQSGWVMFLSNKFLLYGVIGGGGVILLGLGGGTVWIFRKRKMKKK